MGTTVADDAGDGLRIQVTAFPTSNLFAQRAPIRLDMSSSNFPHFDVNPNTGEPEARATSVRIAMNRVYADASAAITRRVA